MKSKIKSSVKGIIVFCLIFLIASCKKKDNRPRDADGYVYDTIQIGNQIWMKENLRTTKYNDGSPIVNKLKNQDWEHFKKGAYTCYDDDENNVVTYGRLYNWYALKTGKLAPKGWHIATKTEWDKITSLFKNDSVGNRVKAKHVWTCKEEKLKGITNSSGLSVLPGGLRNFGGDTFYQIGESAYFWTPNRVICDVDKSKKPFCIVISNNVTNIGSSDCYNERFAMSVRCVKD
jgi:uncharacterized protein (TIGR02145 family)